MRFGSETDEKADRPHICLDPDLHRPEADGADFVAMAVDSKPCLAVLPAFRRRLFRNSHWRQNSKGKVVNSICRAVTLKSDCPFSYFDKSRRQMTGSRANPKRDRAIAARP